MPKNKKNSSPKLVPTAGAASSSSLFRTASSGAVRIAAHAAPHVPPPSFSSVHAAGKAKAQRKAAGPAETQMTEELKRELLLVKMRGVLDPKRFYRSADSGKGLPKVFQLGTIVEGAEDGWHNKLTKKQRKGSIMQELMADSAIKKRAKTQFLKSQAENSAGRKRMTKNKGPGNKRKRR